MIPDFETAINTLNVSSDERDKELAAIFKAHEPIKELYEVIRDEHADDWQTFGYRFHKSFRQVDVVRGDHGKTDMRCWALLRETETFWKMLAGYAEAE